MIPALLAGSSSFKERKEVFDCCVIFPGYLIFGALKNAYYKCLNFNLMVAFLVTFFHCHNNYYLLHFKCNCINLIYLFPYLLRYFLQHFMDGQYATKVLAIKWMHQFLMVEMSPLVG